MAQLICKNVSVGNEGKVLFSGLTFEVQKGEYLCILGENGSGKTTLMKTLLGLQAPLEGEIRFSDGLNQKEIAYLPQQTMVQRDFPASVEEIVRTGLLGRMGLFPFYRKKDRRLAEMAMEKMGILSLRGQSYRKLSGGQQQRVLLARALCATQKLILLDEPVTGLDPQATEKLYQQIGQLNQEGITVIMISHDLSAAIRYASHILYLGDSLFYGRTEDFLHSKEGEWFVVSGREKGSANA